MEHTKELVSVPLAALVASPLNVRRYSSGQVEELAALIDSQGLLHNLVVTRQTRRLARGRGDCKGGGSTRVRFAVAAGERRRRALLLLQARGRLPKDHEVLCELVPPERALEGTRPGNPSCRHCREGSQSRRWSDAIQSGTSKVEVASTAAASTVVALDCQFQGSISSRSRMRAVGRRPRISVK